MTNQTVTVAHKVVRVYELPGMHYDEMIVALNRLGLERAEAATMMGYKERTIRSWAHQQIPQVAANCLRAWIKLQDAGLDWNPLIPKDTK